MCLVLPSIYSKRVAFLWVDIAVLHIGVEFDLATIKHVVHCAVIAVDGQSCKLVHMKHRGE